MWVFGILPAGYISWYLPSQACMCVWHLLLRDVGVWHPAVMGYWCLAPRYCGMLVSGALLLQDIGVWHLAIVGYWCLTPRYCGILVSGTPPQSGMLCVWPLPWQDMLWVFGAPPWQDVLCVFGTHLGRLCVSSIWHRVSVPCGFTNPTPLLVMVVTGVTTEIVWRYYSGPHSSLNGGN